MRRILCFLLLLTTTAVFVRCDSGDDNDNPNTTGSLSDNWGSSVSRDFIGQIVDLSNNPVQNATVKVGSLTAQTDQNGVFIINGATVFERFAHITATKAGFIDGSRSMVPTNGKNKVKIMLIPSAPIATVATGQNSEVSLPSGTKVAFDGSFEDASGNAYSGNVSVSVFELLPSNDNLAELMPGMLYAEEEDGDEAALQTFGMMNVELRGSAGQKLQIADGHRAEITLDIDPAQIATAPSTIPLWYFDEATGYWKEEGIATRVGDKYVGEVSHFSWWNCDAPFPTISLTVNVVTENGDPLANIPIRITADISPWPSMGYTTSNGSASGMIPSNQTLIMEILDPCGVVIYTTTIGPFSATTVLPTIVIPDSMIQTTEVTGSLQQCSAAGNVTDGYVILNYGTVHDLVAVTDGDFSFNVTYCSSSSSFTLQGFDYENLQQTDSIAYTFTSPVTNIGNLTACSTISEFITYQIDGGEMVYLFQNLVANANGTVGGLTIYGNSDTDQSLYIFGNTVLPGIYTTAQFSIEGNSTGYISNGTPNTMSFVISNFGNVGEYIDMTFNGTYTDSITHTLTGTVHVIRDN